MKALNVVLACVLFAVSALAQQQNQDEMVTVTVPKSSLSVQQQASIQQEHAKTWIGIGKEFGDAVNSGLAAVTTQSNNFAQTPVGKITVFLIAWKILGDQITHFIGGTLEILIFLPLWIWSYRRICLPKTLLVRETIGQDKQKIKEWKVVNDDDRDTEGWRQGHWAIAVAMLVVILVTVFSY